ncbi:MAG: ABC transporter substrate-binding protein [Candidatus Thorarchaeota archaeon]
MSCHRWPFAILLLVLLSANVLLTPISVAGSGSLRGPVVDSIQYVVIDSESERVQSLLNGSVDLLADDISLSSLLLLENEDSISVVKTPGESSTKMYINCAKYPYNITDFRRALAYTIDKNAICSEVFGGLAEPRDAYLSMSSPFSIEGDLGSFYEGDATTGNQLLNDSGFDHDHVSGNRTTPDDSALHVLIEYDNVDSEVLGYITAAFTALNISYSTQETAVFSLDKENYDIHCLGSGTYDTMDIRHFANSFRSNYAGPSLLNRPNFVNATMDIWSDQLDSSTQIEEIAQAAVEMQKIADYECPVIPLFDEYIVNAYRSDRLGDIVALGEYGIANWVTNHIGQRTDIAEEFGGQIRIGISSGLTDLNFMRVLADYWKGWIKTNPEKVLENLYDSLFIIGPDGMDMPWLAESYVVRTHEDDSAIPDGSMEVTFIIVDDATWSDGTPITAYDVEYSLDFYIEGLDQWANTYGSYLYEVTGVDATDDATVVVKVEDVSYWDIYSIARVAIIPEHYFVSVGSSGWDLWDPTVEDLVVSAHFLPTNGDIYNLTVNQDHFGFNRLAETSSPTTTTTTPIPWFPLPDDFILMLALGLIGIGIVIVIVIVVRRR